MTDNIVPFAHKTYTAKLEQLTASGLDIRIAGSLDGYIDFAVTPVDRPGLTYSLTRDDARRIIAALNAVIADVLENCLFEWDALLIT
jgi:hypothetical protein